MRRLPAGKIFPISGGFRQHADDYNANLPSFSWSAQLFIFFTTMQTLIRSGEGLFRCVFGFVLISGLPLQPEEKQPQQQQASKRCADG